MATGAGIYTATQKTDPSGEAYNSTGYAGVSGTSYAVPMVAGAVAIAKQKHPAWTPAQLKSAVVNTATQNITDTDGTQARVNAVGAGKLNAGDALNVAATLDPATLSFGAVTTTTISNSLTLKITNVTSAAATFTFTVQPRDTSSATVTVTPSTISNLGAGLQNSVSVRLSGTLPNPGSYEGFIVVNGPAGTPTLRVPYLYLVGSGVPADIFPVYDGAFIGFPGQTEWPIAFRLIDLFGVPVVGPQPVQFSVVEGGGAILRGDSQTYRYGIAGAFVKLGPQAGPHTFRGTVGNLSVDFNGYARPYPSIRAGGVVDAASNLAGQGLAPGSYIAIYGDNLSDALQIVSTTFLPVSLSTVSVSFDGGGLSLPGHLHFVSPGQVNVQIPWEFQGQSSVLMKVNVSGNAWYLQSDTYTRAAGHLLSELLPTLRHRGFHRFRTWQNRQPGCPGATRPHRGTLRQRTRPRDQRQPGDIGRPEPGRDSGIHHRAAHGDCRRREYARQFQRPRARNCGSVPGERAPAPEYPDGLAGHRHEDRRRHIGYREADGAVDEGGKEKARSRKPEARSQNRTGRAAALLPSVFCILSSAFFFLPPSRLRCTMEASPSRESHAHQPPCP